LERVRKFPTEIKPKKPKFVSKIKEKKSFIRLERTVPKEVKFNPISSRKLNSDHH